MKTIILNPAFISLMIFTTVLTIALYKGAHKTKGGSNALHR